MTINFDLERMKEAIESPISDITLEDLNRMIDEGKTWKVTNGSWIDEVEEDAKI